MPLPFHISQKDPSGSAIDGNFRDLDRRVEEQRRATLTSTPPTSHTHPQSDIDDLVSDLAGKAPLSHSHDKADLPASVAYEDEANLFTDQQSIKPTTDAHILNLTRGTDSSPVNALIRIRNNAETQMLFRVDANGKVFGTGLDAGSQRITAVANPTANTDALNRQSGLLKTQDALGTVWAPQGQALAAPTSTGHSGTNFHHYCVIVVSQRCLVTGVRYKVGATSDGNVNAALYAADGSKVADTATVIAQAAANTRQEVAFASTAVIDPGLYTALLRLTSGASTAFCWAPADFLGPADEGSAAAPATKALPTGLTTVPVPAITVY